MKITSKKIMYIVALIAAALTQVIYISYRRERNKDMNVNSSNISQSVIDSVENVDFSTIKIMPAPNLIIPCKKIKVFSKRLNELFRHLYLNMFRDGIGIAAPQIGVNLACIMLNYESLKDTTALSPALAKLDVDGKEVQVFILINPKILSASGSYFFKPGEGCLSVPSPIKNDHFRGLVKRHQMIVLEFQDMHGKTHTMTLVDLPATVVQHELDHVDGILYIHRMKHQNNIIAFRKLMANYIQKHCLHAKQKEVNSFVEYGEENINNPILIETNEQIEAICKKRNIDPAPILGPIIYLETQI